MNAKAKSWSILVSMLVLVFCMADSCDSPEQVKAFNRNSLANDPEIIGKINDLPIKRYTLESPDGYTHYLYIVGNQVTANDMYHVGKQTRVNVEAILAEDPRPLDITTKVKLENLKSRIQDCQNLLDTLQAEVTNVLNQAR